MSGERCTWVIEAHFKATKLRIPDDEREVVPDRVCDKLACVDYIRPHKASGRIPSIEHNVRCRTHATPEADSLAVITGYEAKALNDGEKDTE